MESLKFDQQLETMYSAAVRLAHAAKASAVLILLDGPTNWHELRERAEGVQVIVAADTIEVLEGAAAVGLSTVVLEMKDSPLYAKLSQALLEAVADEILAPGARVVTLYSGFEANVLDSISVIDLGEHLGRLTVRDLQQIETRVPLDTLQTVLNLALEIGREGREGKAVGTLFVVGDMARVRKHCRTIGFDPVKGYSRKERNLKSAKVREAIKEIAQLDGAILVSADGTVEAAGQYVDAPAAGITLAKGLGARHWTAAAISKVTNAVAVTVSQSSGTVRLFKNGEAILQIEPLRRAMKWRGFEFEPLGGE
jgi:DNA integrity scanning protein DisA with diadenylate cyclase activity